MLNAKISITRERAPELYCLTVMSRHEGKWRQQTATLGIHQLVPVLSALEIEPEIVESFYELPAGASLQWSMALTERHAQQFTHAISL